MTLRKTFHATVATVLGVVASSAAFADTLSASISGTVRRTSDNAGIANVEVDLFHASYYDVYVDTTVTDGSGNYVFQQLQAGDYNVQTNGATPYADQFYAGHPLVPPSQGNPIADAISVGDGQSVGAIDFNLTPGGSVTGILTDRFTGLPIANAANMEFFVYDAGAPSSNSVWLYRYVSTDADGRYQIDGLPDAAIYLGAGAFNYGLYYAESIYGCALDPCDLSTTAATTLNVQAGTTQTADFSLFPGWVITGTVVRRSDGLPIANALVTSFVNMIWGPGTTGTARTDANGHYALTGGLGSVDYVKVTEAHLSGNAYISQLYNDHDCQQGSCAVAGDPVNPTEYQVLPGVDFQLDLGASIAGQVVRQDAGTGIPAGIRLYAADGSLSDTFSSYADGTFETSGLQPGTYYLAADPGPASGYDCLIYSGASCTSDVAATGQPIVIAGTQNVGGIVIAVPNDTVFSDSFE